MSRQQVCPPWNLFIIIICLVQLTLSPSFINSTRLSDDKIQADDFQHSGVQLSRDDDGDHIVMSNGIVSLTLTTPDGDITNVAYKDGDNLLETQNPEEGRGYWTVVWNNFQGSESNTIWNDTYLDVDSDDFMKLGRRNGTLQRLSGTSYKVILQNESQTEISFTSTWTVGSQQVPLNIDKRYIMLRDSPGFYSYTVLERLEGWPAFGIGVVRLAFKLQENKFHYMAVSEERQRIMPSPEDRENGQVLDFKEAVLLTNPSNQKLKGEVDDKYLYTCDNKDNKVHGWVSNDSTPVGFWMITPSNEFRSGGPLKQDLTSHTGPTTLSVFHSSHYAGDDLSLEFETGEYWKKVYGPIFVYVNSIASEMAKPSVLWYDAKQMAAKEVASWPYSFPLSTDFLKSSQRGALHGQLLIRELLVDEKTVAVAGAYIGLAKPGEDGSWQTESKSYQFWSKTDDYGNFIIRNVVPGNYSLFAWIPGKIGDYKHPNPITIPAGSVVEATDVVFEPPRQGPTLWEIGVPDRSAAEFLIPEPDPMYKMHPYRIPTAKFREYGLWRRYQDLYPEGDLVFTIGSSNYTKDWFFAHVTRKLADNTYAATTWRIVFNCETVKQEQKYTLQLALASANGANLEVRLNDPESPPLFTTGPIGRDNAVARHGIRGLYRLYTIPVPGNMLRIGNNTILLTQSQANGPFHEVMYDYIRFEGPPQGCNGPRSGETSGDVQGHNTIMVKAIKTFLLFLLFTVYM